MRSEGLRYGLRRAIWMLGVMCALCAALLLAACGSSGDSSAPATSGGATKTANAGKLRSILFVNPLPDNPQWRVIGDAMKAEGEALGVEVTETGPTDAADATRMIEEIQQGIAGKEGAIVTYPVSAAFGPVLKQAEAAGIITGTMYGGPTSAVGQFNTGPDFNKLGELYVRAIAERPGPQRVGLLAADSTGTGGAWMDGVRAAAAQTDNVEIVGVVYTGDDPARALSQANALLAAHPEINVLASHMGTATTPSVSAIKAKGLKGRVVMLANGAVAGGLEGAREGIVYRFLLQNLRREGQDAVRAAIDRAAGKDVPAQINVETTMVGLDDFEQYDARGWS